MLFNKAIVRALSGARSPDANHELQRIRCRTHRVDVHREI